LFFVVSYRGTKSGAPGGHVQYCQWWLLVSVGPSFQPSGSWNFEVARRKQKICEPMVIKVSCIKFYEPLGDPKSSRA
jgi:hypothetical protein